MRDPARHRVLLVEDDASTRSHLERALRDHADLVCVGAVGSVAAGRELLETGEVDVLLTDLGLPDGTGIELIVEATKRSLLSLVITVFGDEKHVVEAIRAGALGYLLKDEPSSDVGAAVHDVIRGGSPISPAIARYLLGRMREEPAGAKAEVPVLSERETEVLRYIVKGFTYDEIAKLTEISTHTVATHIRKIYRKLSVHSRGEAVYEALQLGIVRSDD